MLLDRLELCRFVLGKDVVVPVQVHQRQDLKHHHSPLLDVVGAKTTCHERDHRCETFPWYALLGENLSLLLQLLQDAVSFALVLLQSSSNGLEVALQR